MLKTKRFTLVLDQSCLRYWFIFTDNLKWLKYNLHIRNKILAPIKSSNNMIHIACLIEMKKEMIEELIDLLNMEHNCKYYKC